MSFYKQDPNNPKKQIPISRTGTGFYSHATIPPSFTVNKRPSYVNVNKVGTFLFLMGNC